MGGVDARDFIRGTRPWSQFLNYSTYLGTNVTGSAMWAAQLEDDRFLSILEKKLEDAKDEPPARPSLYGYTREVDSMHRVAVELRALRAEMGKWGEGIPILGPLFPSEKLKMRDEKQEVADLMSAIQEGHSNWAMQEVKLVD